MSRMMILVLSLAICVLICLVIGDVNLSPAEFWRGLWTGEGSAALTISLIRAPRVLTALGAGMALGLSGALFQMLLRNTLASPDVMGFNSGAALAVLLSVWAGLSAPMPLIASAGGIMTAMLVALASWRKGHNTSVASVILAGIGVGFTTTAVSAFIMLSLPGSEALEAQRWMAGSFSARNWDHAMRIWSLVGVLLLALVLQLNALRLLELGDELAAGLGLKVERARWMLAATGVLLASAGVATAGPIPFLALMAAPLGARVTRAQTPEARLMSGACAGGIIAVMADLASRALVPGVQLPIGVMIGLLGAPYLLWLLSREMKRGEI